jgi:hypothetical protein
MSTARPSLFAAEIGSDAVRFTGVGAEFIDVASHQGRT